MDGRRKRYRSLAGLAAVLLGLTGLAGTARAPASGAESSLVATILEVSDLHSDGSLNDSHLLATSSVATALNPDAIMVAGDLTNHGYADEFAGLWGAWVLSVVGVHGVPFVVAAAGRPDPPPPVER